MDWLALAFPLARCRVLLLQSMRCWIVYLGENENPRKHANPKCNNACDVFKCIDSWSITCCLELSNLASRICHLVWGLLWLLFCFPPCNSQSLVLGTEEVGWFYGVRSKFYFIQDYYLMKIWNGGFLFITFCMLVALQTLFYCLVVVDNFVDTYCHNLLCYLAFLFLGHHQTVANIISWIIGALPC